MITTCNKRMMGAETLRWFGVQERKRGLAVWYIDYQSCSYNVFLILAAMMDNNLSTKESQSPRFK